jgi:NADH-quinone oxidoreductase subunit C
MDRTQLGEFVKSLKPDAIVTEGKQYTEVTIADTELHSLAKKLRESEETWFDFLVCLTGVDHSNDFEVVYHLRSTRHGHMIVLKTRTSGREKPVLNSVCDIWKTAEFHEREVYDLMGVKFNNHPDLRRLFLDSSWGFPLRKDYVDDVNIVTK